MAADSEQLAADEKNRVIEQPAAGLAVKRGEEAVREQIVASSCLV